MPSESLEKNRGRQREKKEDVERISLTNIHTHPHTHAPNEPFTKK